jgi:hypothetical protein
MWIHIGFVGLCQFTASLLLDPVFSPIVENILIVMPYSDSLGP